MFNDHSAPQEGLPYTLRRLLHRDTALRCVHMPRELGRRRRLLRLRRIALMLCCAGIAVAVGLLLLPEQRVSVPVPRADVAQGRRVDVGALDHRQVPISVASDFLRHDDALCDCVARIRLPHGHPVPVTACTRVPPLAAGQTLVSIPTSLTPGSIDPGARASARVKGSAPVPVVLWGFENGSDGITRARVAVDASKAMDLLEAASAGTVLLSPAR